MNKNTLTKSAYMALFGVLLIAVNIFITKHLMSSQLQALIEGVKVSKVFVHDMDASVDKMLKEGKPALEILAYTDNLVKVMRHQGIILLDKANVITSPPSAVLPVLTETELHAYLVQHGIEISRPEQFKALSEQSAKTLSELFTEQP
jgi:hypothetical protein